LHTRRKYALKVTSVESKHAQIGIGETRINALSHEI